MVVVYLSPVPWKSIAQRSHFFADYCLKNGVKKFIWVEPVASRFPKFSDLKSKLVDVVSGSFEPPKSLEIIKPNILIPIEPYHNLYKFINCMSLNQVENRITDLIFQQSNVKLICGKPSVLSMRLIENVKFESIIFDIMDDYPYFFTGRASSSMKILLDNALSRADEVWFSSADLFDKYKSRAIKPILVKNACDKNFAIKLKALNAYNKLPEQIVYGYIGSIAKWFDWEFVIKLANNRPNALIRLIGPAHVVVPSLPDNVIVESAIEHKNVPAMLRNFDFAIIPFKVNELTQAVDPVKYYEYVAAELPIITTEFGEMKARVISLHAVTLDSHLNGLQPNKEKVIFWEDRFCDLL